MPKTKFYVVWIGQKPGIYTVWEECRKQVQGFGNARYMAFDTEAEAREAMANGWKTAYAAHNQSIGLSGSSESRLAEPSGDSPKQSQRPTVCFIAVDAACSGNPGKMEYRGVYVQPSSDSQGASQAREIFHVGPFEEGTNNIGEYLAIVHALALQKQKQTRIPVYSDSANGLSWVKKKHCGTKLAPSPRNAPLFELIKKADNWLATNTYEEIPLNKWRTELWGEVPADFGRK